jgi:protein tyrosine phosphatase (PTP) superfamily phosphohydrolase (DUF442 family)
MRCTRGLLIAIALMGSVDAMTVLPSAAQQPGLTASRPGAWAVPLTVDGAPNLHRITPTFYRSAQPAKAGFVNLETGVGIKTVVSLRAFNSDKPLLVGTGLTLVSVPINTWNIKRSDVVRALAAIQVAEGRGAVLLHCQHGADRTGLISALHRILNDGWTREAALDEMRNGAFGYHAVWGNIPRFIKKVDIEALRLDVAAAVKAAG